MTTKNIGRELINTRDVINDQVTFDLVENHSKDLTSDQIRQISLAVKSIVIKQFDGLIDRVAG